MPLPPSLNSACHCVNPRCPRPYPQSWNDQQCRQCGTTLRLHNRYIPLQRLQVGHSIHLYEVYDQETGVEKLMRLLVAIAPKAIEIFNREVMALSSLHHRGLPKIEAPAYFHIDISQPAGSSLPCLIFEKIEGISLQELLTQHPKGCPEAWVMNWFQQTVLILQKLHSRRLLHRDLQPSSLVLRSGGQQVAIADIGFPKAIVSPDSTQLLSGGYAPPEQTQGEPIGPSADFYALGRICIHLLTGQHPLSLEDPAGVLQWRARARIQPAFADLLDRLVQADSRLRLHTAADILEELNRISTKAVAPAPPVRPAPPPPAAPVSQGFARARPVAKPDSGRKSGSTGSSGKLVAVARTSPKRQSYTSSSGGMYSRHGASSGGRQTPALSSSTTHGRYREDPHPRNLMSHRPKSEGFQTRVSGAIAWTEQVQEWLVQISVVLFRAMVFASLGGAIAAGIGFWIVYSSPLAPYITSLFAHQLASPRLPLVVKPAMIVFAFAGVGTAWGLTQTHNLEMQHLVWRQRAIAGVTYAIAWLAWQWGTVGSDGSVGMARCTAIIAIGMVIALGAQGNLLVQAIMTTLGTSLTFSALLRSEIWQPGDLLYLFYTTRPFIPTEAMGWAAIAFFGLLGIVVSFWLGFSYYIGLPCLEQVSRWVRPRL